MKIIFISNSIVYGGAEIHTIELCKELSNCGNDVTLIYLRKNKKELEYCSINNSKMKIWTPNLSGIFDLRGLYKILNRIKKQDPDLVFCVNEFPLIYGHLIKKLSGIKYRLISIYHSTELSKYEKLKMIIYKRLFNRSDKIVYVGTNQRKYWEQKGFKEENGIVINNGVDVNRFDGEIFINDNEDLRRKIGIDKDTFVFGVNAAMRPEKRHSDLIEAISELVVVCNINVKCIFIGGGVLEDEIKEQIKQKNVEKYFILTGYQNDVRPYISICDCMILLSERESLSLSAIESMLMSKPMIMSNVGEANKLISDGYNGYLYKFGEIGELKKLIIKIYLSDENLKWGKNSRIKAVQHFDKKVMIDKYMNLIIEEIK